MKTRRCVSKYAYSYITAVLGNKLLDSSLHSAHIKLQQQFILTHVRSSYLQGSDTGQSLMRSKSRDEPYEQMSSVSGPGLLSRSLSRTPRIDEHAVPISTGPRSEQTTEGISAYAHECTTVDEDDGVFGKFANSPSPAISHAMHIPGFRAHQSQYSSPIIGSMGRSMPFGSLPIGSLGSRLSSGALAFGNGMVSAGMSPESVGGSYPSPDSVYELLIYLLLIPCTYWCS